MHNPDRLSAIFIHKLYLYILVISLYGCQLQPSKPESFAEFFTHFRQDNEFSLNRTQFPLLNYRYEYGVDENGNDESITIKEEISREQLAKHTLADYLSDNQLQHALLTERSSPNEQVVKIYKEDTDWLLHYHFVLHDGHWYLHSVHDYSL